MELPFSKELEALRRAGRAPLETAREYAFGRRAVGHLLTDVPVELIHAAGFYPVQILGRRGQSGEGNLSPVAGSGDFPEAAGELQSFTCGYARGSVDLALDGSLDFLSGVIVPFICDSTRCADIVLRSRKPFKFIEAYRCPKSLTGPGAREYLIGEIGRLLRVLEAQSGRGRPVSDLVLKRTIELFNRARGLLRRIERLRADDPHVYFDICRAATVLPVEVFIELMEKVFPLAAMALLHADRPENAVDIMLSGKIPEPYDLPQTLSRFGLRIVADDLAIGGRLYAVDVDERMAPIEALADRQLRQIPFAGFLQPVEDRPDFLARRARETGAKGVIMLVLKFCEIFELDAPEVREKLLRERIPVLILETDMVATVTPMMRTRIEAFMEMLRHG